ncbi:exodeoxyribonuclease V subunit alpha [Gordonia sp. SID5947]|uniref:exodeoxyribonuclease V subunit alpha n=1 Tax=Gordonia sp. SID5947 TaxID=2690315 RepID=UPI00136AAD09|nr:exodeoxyribonuclease V subunit alpha [Gordonia sp. SID5947]MYR05422.1 exodeoxyribonuclease V subunit alpha [Gordonia sp. SID5947]
MTITQSDGTSGRDPEGSRPVRTTSDPRTVASGDGTLGLLNSRGVLDAADVHVTRRLVLLSGGHVSDAAQIATALAVRAVRQGSTCLAIGRVPEIGADDAAVAEVLPSPDELERALVDCVLVRGGETGPLRPLVLATSDDGPLLYLRKYFRQEELIRSVLGERRASRPDVDVSDVTSAVEAVFGPADPGDADLQRIAAQMAAVSWTLVVAGGPGTGKTYTVARILAVLDRLAGGSARIGLCAPTGRAAAQLQAAVSADEAAPRSVHAVTVHSLLGWRPGSAPRFGRGNKLPHDVVVVDETSMLSMTAMSKLLDAVRPDARVILVGDPHQLASVEAGAVLADLVDRDDAAAPTPIPRGVLDEDVMSTISDRDRVERGVVTLRRGHRFGGGIARVAAAINRGDTDSVLDLVGDPSLADVTLVAADDLDEVRTDVVAWGTALRAAAMAADADGALDALDGHRVLCAHREGVWGVQGWSHRVVEWLADVPDHPPHLSLDSTSREAGQPILVTATDRQAGTFNGDSGVVVRTGRAEGTLAAPEPDTDALKVVFRRGAQIFALHPTQLADAVPMYAMTIHRSQGSQFDGVTVILPPEGSELLTRELLYTAVTRARRRVRIVGSPEILAAAVARRVQRASGLRSPIRVVEAPEAT